jgi:hypothetical protein
MNYFFNQRIKFKRQSKEGKKKNKIWKTLWKENRDWIFKKSSQVQSFHYKNHLQLYNQWWSSCAFRRIFSYDVNLILLRLCKTMIE